MAYIKRLQYHVAHRYASHLQHGCVCDAFGCLLLQGATTREQLLHHLHPFRRHGNNRHRAPLTQLSSPRHHIDYLTAKSWCISLKLVKQTRFISQLLLQHCSHVGLPLCFKKHTVPQKTPLCIDRVRVVVVIWIVVPRLLINPIFSHKIVYFVLNLHLADALIQSDLQKVQGNPPEASRVKCLAQGHNVI